VCTLFKNSFLQQNAFDDVDRYSSPEKQSRMMGLLLIYWHRGLAAIKGGVPLADIKRMKVLQEINKMKFTITDDRLEEFEKLQAKLERAIDRLEADNA